MLQVRPQMSSLFAMAGAALLARGPALLGQSGPRSCATPDWQSENLITILRQVVSDTGPAADTTRSTYHLEFAAHVVLVQDSHTCSRGAAAYSRATGDTSAGSRQRRVFVIRVGDRYVVDDPYTPAHAGEFALWCIVDRRWNPLVCLTD